MAFHLVAYYQVVDEGGVFTELDPVPDESVRVEGKQIFIPRFNHLIGYLALLGSTAMSAYFDAPSLRHLSLLYLGSIDPNTTSYDGSRVIMVPRGIATLEEGEGLKFVSKADPTAAEPHSCLVWLADAPLEPVEGPFTCLEYAVSGTVTAGKWSNLTLSPVQSLPVGVYHVVGGTVVLSGGIAWRLIFVGLDQRPGLTVASGVYYGIYPWQLPGALGSWGTFHTKAPPTLQVLSTGTSLPTRVVLWLKKE